MTAAPTSTGAVAFSGEPGSFAEDAVLRAFGEVERVGVPGFPAVFEAVAGGAAAVGVVPIENVVAGTIRETLDLLLAHDLVIVGEVVVPVRLCLAALPGQRIEDIERVSSHVQALEQASDFLRSRPWTLVSTYNTAGAGKDIVERAERGSAAVLSPRAAAVFGLEVLAADIASDPLNRTRFWLVARPGAAAPQVEPAAGSGHRTTVVFGVRNEPGTLLAALHAFADRGVNLSKLESRPSRERAWEYVFWADLDGSEDDPACSAALADLGARATLVRVLGSYPRATD
ncbi:MAG TPA: prephenate dehydratase [Candidatus Limnocylindrales bacterium]